MRIPFKGAELAVFLSLKAFGESRVKLLETGINVEVSSVYKDADEISRHVVSKLMDWLKAQARLAITQEVELQRQQFRFEYNGIRIKDTRSRWGSCSVAGNLNFNWRLILAEPRAIKYLVTHETAHLSEMNHSREFWKLVENRMYDYNFTKNYLKEKGNELMKWELRPELFLAAARQLWT